MTDPAKITKRNERFWQRMHEAFGSQWQDKHGLVPSAAWCAVLDRFDNHVIKLALDRMGERRWEHPPSLPLFKAWLAECEKAHQTNARDFTADFWRSVVLGSVMQDGSLQQPPLWPYRCPMRHLPEDIRQSVMAKVEALTTELTTMEQQTGKRSPALFDHARTESWRFVSTLRVSVPPSSSQATSGEIHAHGRR